MLRKSLWIAIFLCFFHVDISTATDSRTVTYQSAEHIFMGDLVVLHGLDTPPPHQPIEFNLPNGLQLTYGEILAMPDFYGDPNHPISSETTMAARKARFATIFSDFSHNDIAYFQKFWPIIQHEREQVAQAIRLHQDVSQLYATLNDKEIMDLAIATQLRYLILSANEFDHFSQHAIDAYQAGHSVAIDTALTGFQIKSGEDLTARQLCQQEKSYWDCLDRLAKEKLILAYEQNAYACHFLADRFASGHIRTPFWSLIKTRSVLGGVSGSLMHSEDNRLGLIVTNTSGQYWIAYGDNYYFSEKNAANVAVLQDTLQKSANEINQAFQSGIDPDPESNVVIGLIPQPIAASQVVHVPGIGEVRQTDPLYRVIDNVVYQRLDVNDLFCNQWTPIWSTLLTLLLYHQPKNTALIPTKWQLILTQQHLDDILKQVGIAPRKLSLSRSPNFSKNSSSRGEDRGI